MLHDELADERLRHALVTGKEGRLFGEYLTAGGADIATFAIPDDVCDETGRFDGLDAIVVHLIRRVVATRALVIGSREFQFPDMIFDLFRYSLGRSKQFVVFFS